MRVLAFGASPEEFERMHKLATLLNRVTISESGCWLWQGWVDRDGYGQCQVAGTRKKARAHRLCYVLTKGTIPEGLVLDHLCKVRNCVNPDHLDPVTPAENVYRGHVATARARSHCKHGHEWTEANTKWTKAGGRVCRRCCADRERARYHK